MGNNKIIKHALIPVKILLRNFHSTRVGVGTIRQKDKTFEVLQKSLTLTNGYTLGKQETTIQTTPDPLIWKITTKIFEVAYGGFIYLENREVSDPIKGYIEAENPLAVQDSLPFFYGYPEDLRDRLYYRVGTAEDKQVLVSYLGALEESRKNAEPILFAPSLINPLNGQPILPIPTDPEPITPENMKRKIAEIGVEINKHYSQNSKP